MGNQKLRLSDMIPNAWFYKLKDMTTLTNHKITNKNVHATSSSSSSLAPTPPSKNNPSKIPHPSDQRKSYYINRDLNSPLKPTISAPDKHDFVTGRSSTRRRRRRSSNKNKDETRLVSSSSFGATLESVWTKPPPDVSQPHQISSYDEHGSDRTLIPDSSTNSCKCKIVNKVVRTNRDDVSRIPCFDQRQLPPIITKKQQHHEPKKIQPSGQISPVRRISGNSSLSPGVKLRTNTPRIANRKIQGRKSLWWPSRQSVWESFAVMKSSKDPERDFKESMMEMIVENKIRASKDLEELLACYLSLNSREYHELIINVFKQIWLDFIRFRLK